MIIRLKTTNPVEMCPRHAESITRFKLYLHVPSLRASQSQQPRSLRMALALTFPSESLPALISAASASMSTSSKPCPPAGTPEVAASSASSDACE